MTVFFEPPPDFRPSGEAAGCFIESDSEILFLKRASDRIEGNTWNIPGGKLEPGEEPRAAVFREIFEEAGLFIDTPDLEFLGRLYVGSAVDCIFHVFRKPFSRRPAFDLDLSEHTEARWLTPAQILLLPLIHGGAEALQFYTQRKSPYAHQ